MSILCILGVLGVLGVPDDDYRLCSAVSLEHLFEKDQSKKVFWNTFAFTQKHKRCSKKTAVQWGFSLVGTPRTPRTPNFQ